MLVNFEEISECSIGKNSVCCGEVWEVSLIHVFACFHAISASAGLFLTSDCHHCPSLTLVYRRILRSLSAHHVPLVPSTYLSTIIDVPHRYRHSPAPSTAAFGWDLFLVSPSRVHIFAIHVFGPLISSRRSFTDMVVFIQTYGERPSPDLSIRQTT